MDTKIMFALFGLIALACAKPLVLGDDGVILVAEELEDREAALVIDLEGNANDNTWGVDIDASEHRHRGYGGYSRYGGYGGYRGYGGYGGGYGHRRRHHGRFYG